jgi:hypothetical protein
MHEQWIRSGLSLTTSVSESFDMGDWEVRQTYQVSLERRELQQGIGEVIQRVGNSGFEEAQSLHGNSEVVVVGR